MEFSYVKRVQILAHRIYTRYGGAGTARILRFCGPVGRPIWARCVRSRPAWRGQTLDRGADLGRFDEKLRRGGNDVELLARNLRTKGVALFCIGCQKVYMNSFQEPIGNIEKITSDSSQIKSQRCRYLE